MMRHGSHSRTAVQFGKVGLALLLLGSIVPARAQQFSADIVLQRDVTLVPDGRLRVLEHKVRIETPEFADGFFLVDAEKPAAWFVRPGAQVYMEARQSSQLTRLLVPVDADEPCRQWQAMTHLAGIAEQSDWHCERTGEAIVAGRNTIGFHAITGSGRAYDAWLDRELRIALRIKADDGTIITLENIRDEPQSASLFELSPTWRSFSPEALIERIKQSDVWVSQQHDEKH